MTVTYDRYIGGDTVTPHIGYIGPHGGKPRANSAVKTLLQHAQWLYRQLMAPATGIHGVLAPPGDPQLTPRRPASQIEPEGPQRLL